MAKIPIERQLRQAQVHALKGARDKAALAYRAVLAEDPGNRQAQDGLARLGGGGSGEAPAGPRQLILQAIARLEARCPDEALALADQAAALSPGSGETELLRGLALKALGLFPRAIEAFTAAEQFLPGDFRPPLELGRVLAIVERFEEALAAYQRALALNAQHGQIHERLGSLHSRMKNFPESVAAYEEALRLGGHSDYVFAHKLLSKLNCADWSAFADFAEHRDTLGMGADAVSPFATFPLDDSPARQLERARAFTRRFLDQPDSEPLPPRPAVAGRRIRIGYFSASIYDHPVAYLTTGLFRHHDKSVFEVVLYSYSHSRGGAMRDEIARDVEHFVDVSAMTDDEVVALARSHELDIAIDMQGYTGDTRSALFARRLAPTQISYLAFPGTMGAPFIDYLVADKVVIPPEQRAHYSESMMMHPDCYLPADNLRVISDKQTTRTDFGLPEQGVVFMSHNNLFKIGPREFDIWMRVMRQVEGSVLWLRSVDDRTRQTIAAHAETRGVDPARIVHAPKLDHPEHLARHRHADLFLDSFNYNAHTTACEALWAGLPVVTKAGEQFAARVCASLLTAVGMPELIAHSEADYEALILDLASDPARLAATKAKLAENRLTHPLFDTAGYTRKLEAMFVVAVTNYRKQMGFVPA